MEKEKKGDHEDQKEKPKNKEEKWRENNWKRDLTERKKEWGCGFKRRKGSRDHQLLWRGGRKRCLGVSSSLQSPGPIFPFCQGNRRGPHVRRVVGDLKMTMSTGHHQGSFIVLGQDVCIGPFEEKELHDLKMTFGTCMIQGLSCCWCPF